MGQMNFLNGKGMNITDYAKIGIAFERVANTTSRFFRKSKKMVEIYNEIDI